MGWKTINGRRYYYKSKRVRGRVESRYFGAGESGSPMAQIDEFERLERAADRWARAGGTGGIRRGGTGRGRVVRWCPGRGRCRDGGGRVSQASGPMAEGTEMSEPSGNQGGQGDSDRRGPKAPAPGPEMEEPAEESGQGRRAASRKSMRCCPIRGGENIMAAHCWFVGRVLRQTIAKKASGGNLLVKESIKRTSIRSGRNWRDPTRRRLNGSWPSGPPSVGSW